MRIVPVIGLAFTMSAPIYVHAQVPLAGKYTGDFQTTIRTQGGVTRLMGLTLVIDSIADGVVKGTLTSNGYNCAGAYPVEGKLQDKDLQLRATRKGGRGGDCLLGISGTVNGNKITGTMPDGSPFQLSK
jgi:hypothetical protein